MLSHLPPTRHVSAASVSKGQQVLAGVQHPAGSARAVAAQQEFWAILYKWPMNLPLASHDRKMVFLVFLIHRALCWNHNFHVHLENYFQALEFPVSQG